MDKDILALISRENSGFSKGQRLIAKYILENYDKAAFMTAGKLGKTVGVSESTVVRFAAELGFDGYPGMRKALQEMIRSRLTSVQRIEAAKDMLDDKNILKSVLSDDIDKLQTTLEEIDQDSFNRVVDSILAAGDIYIFASRTSRSLADFMAYYLGLIRAGVLQLRNPVFYLCGLGRGRPGRCDDSRRFCRRRCCSGPYSVVFRASRQRLGRNRGKGGTPCSPQRRGACRRFLYSAEASSRCGFFLLIPAALLSCSPWGCVADG